MNLWTINPSLGGKRARRIARITNKPVGCSYMNPGDGPHLSFRTGGQDGKLYEIALSDADIQEIVRKREYYAAEFAKARPL